MKIKIWIIFLLIMLYSSSCLADYSKNNEIFDLSIMNEECSLVKKLVSYENLKMIYCNNYSNFYKSHNVLSVNLRDEKFMGDLSLSFYYAQFVSRSELSGLQYIKKDAILAHFKKTGFFPFEVLADFTIFDDKGNSVVAAYIQPKEPLNDRIVDFNGKNKKLICNGEYVFVAENEDLIKKLKSEYSIESKRDVYWQIITKLNGYSYIINNDSVIKELVGNDIPKYQSYTLCIGKDKRGYFMGFALYYNTQEEAKNDVLLIDHMIREKPLFTMDFKRMSDFFETEKELVFREKNVLYGKIYQCDKEKGKPYWKNTVLKRDYLF